MALDSIIVPLAILFFSIVSTAVMSYIGMATPIGPWIVSTLVICVAALLRFIPWHKVQTPTIAYIVSGASVGGILATAMGFSLPTLYFLNKPLFLMWLSEPLYFCALLTCLSLSAGFYGFWMADVFEDRLIIKHKLEFPIAQLTYKLIQAHSQLEKAWQMFYGILITAASFVLRDGLGPVPALLQRTLLVIDGSQWVRLGGYYLLNIPMLQLDFAPSFWAIGFVAGHIIAVPLLIGIVSKIILIDPIHSIGFGHLSHISFTLAFCSGMIIFTSFASLLSMPKQFLKTVADGCKTLWVVNKVNYSACHTWRQKYHLCFLVFVIVFSFFFFQHFQFGFLLVLYLMFFALVCSYQVAMIAGRTGLALLGRFATFVMVPALFIFQLKYLQLTFIATFVEVAAGVTTDLVVGRKIAILTNVSHAKLRRYQMLGLFISSCAVGVTFWLLITHFTLGSQDLFAQRAQARALLISVRRFDFLVLILGMMYAFVLEKLEFSAVLVLGGLLMPLNTSIGLMIGGLLSNLAKDREYWFPFWSGVFTTSSLWMLIRTIR